MLQRYRAIDTLPYFTISEKVYYKVSDVFFGGGIKERLGMGTFRKFKKEHGANK